MSGSGESTGRPPTTTTTTTTSTTTGVSTTTDGSTTTGSDGVPDPDTTFGEKDCFGQEVYSVPLSTIEEWIDAEGNVTDCHAACDAAGFDEIYDYLSCSVYHPDWPFPGLGGSSSSGGSGTDTDGGGSTSGGMGTSGGSGESTTGLPEDPEVELTCDWEAICGRGHAGLRSDGRNQARDPVGRWAAKAAHAEAASVPAFEQLGRELVAHGAPASLCQRARAAAREEVAHARMMTRVASRRGATVPRPVVDPLPVRDLERIAIENAVEGCVRETWAALEATHQAQHASAQDLRSVMARIAADETRHAELARDVDAWCRSRLDAEARARVDAARMRAIEELRGRVGIDVSPDFAAATGLPTRSRARHMLDRLRHTLWPALTATPCPRTSPRSSPRPRP